METEWVPEASSDQASMPRKTGIVTDSNSHR